MFVLQSIIKIGDYTFKAVHSVKIAKSVDELADTCTIKEGQAKHSCKHRV